MIKFLGYNYTVEYKRGKENRLAYSLSRVKYKILALLSSAIQPAWITDVISTYANDDKCKELLAQLAINPDCNQDYTLKNGILMYKNKILVGNHIQMNKNLMAAFHKSEIGGHSGERVTFHILQLVLFWPKMRKEVA
jgi:hypothetical protein